MRRIVSVLIVAVLALTLAGCGGGDQPAETRLPATAAAPAAAAAPRRDGAAIGDRSANETSTFEPFPQGDFVPADLKARHRRQAADAHLLLRLLVHEQGQPQDIIDAVRDENRGDRRPVHLRHQQVRRRHRLRESSPSTRRLPTTPTRLRRSNWPRRWVSRSAPFIVITDSQGYIIWKFRGLRRQGLPRARGAARRTIGA